MNAATRREKILEELQVCKEPISATALARQLGVSRQIIVGDIALLRAHGTDIVATVRGYALASLFPAGRFTGKIACRHKLEDTIQELGAIVEHGGTVLDVIVAHDFYGEITGRLNIATSRDVELFQQKMLRNKSRLLSELTGGVHLHTIACRDVSAFEEICAALERLHLLYHA